MMWRAWRRRLVVGLILLSPLGSPASALASGVAAPVDASPLAANGFESPSCTSPLLEAQLSVQERTNCSVSGVAVAPVPLSNYSLDIDIPSGLNASFHEDIDSVVEDLFITPIWTAVVWLDHVALIALEWCYSIDLLAPATLSRAASVLGAARRVFTDPWLGLALAVAAAGFAWQGLVRRRVLDTLGQAALLAVMVTAGLWIVADPSGTVGAVGGLADRAALATVAASATGDPATPVATVDGAFAGVFQSAITGPWCYLEFGDVNWCQDPSDLDPTLHSTAARLETIYRSEASCRGPTIGLVQCAPDGSALQSQLQGAATALGEARSNGDLFLALPADALSRTALAGATPTPTLYGTLCGSNDPTACTAPTAPQAEFRSASGTWPRVGGLLLIVAGTLGMLLLLGFLAIRLLGAALATLLYLLLAPLAVLAPALGEGGRDAFRLWLTRLVGATLAKLVYSVALGVVLLVVSLLSSLNNLGWWTQWLLISVFWWTAFEQRHRLLSLVLHERSEPARRSSLALRASLAARGAGAGLDVVRASGRGTATAGQRLFGTVQRWREFPQAGSTVVTRGRGEATLAAPDRRDAGRDRRAHVRHELDQQVARFKSNVPPPLAAARWGGSFTADRARGGATHSDPRALAVRSERIAAGLRTARAGGDRRRELSLELRAKRVGEQIATQRRAAQAASPDARVGLVARLAPTPVRERVERRSLARRLDRAALSPAAAPGTQRSRSELQAASLAGLAGLTPIEYLSRSAADQRVVRLQIRRELDRRRELLSEIAPAPRAALRERHRSSRPTAEGPDTGAPMARAMRRARQFGARDR
jgi:hypothetical protein